MRTSLQIYDVKVAGHKNSISLWSHHSHTMANNSGVRSTFPNQPQFSGFMKPCRFEGNINSLEIRGHIPEDIDGTFYRVMPDPQLPPLIENDPVCRSRTCVEVVTVG